MYKRAEQLYEIWHRKAYPMSRTTWDGDSIAHHYGWYAVAAAEAEKVEETKRLYCDEYTRLKQDMATMVPRKHYTDAVKSLTVCQQQIETLMLELKRWNPTSQIAQDASVVLGLLESMIDANPNMQTDDYRDSQKQRRDEAERVRREAVVAQMWKVSGTAMDDSSIGAFSDRLKWGIENVKGAVGKAYEP